MWIPCRVSSAGEKTRGEGEFQATNINLREDAQRSWLHGFLSNIPSYPAIPHRRFLERRPLERGSQRAEVVKRLLLGPEAPSISHRRVLAVSLRIVSMDRFCLTFRITTTFFTAYPRQTRDLVGYISPTEKNHDDGVIVTGKWLQSVKFHLDIRLREYRKPTYKNIILYQFIIFLFRHAREMCATSLNDIVVKKK